MSQIVRSRSLLYLLPSSERSRLLPTPRTITRFVRKNSRCRRPGSVDAVGVTLSPRGLFADVVGLDVVQPARRAVDPGRLDRESPLRDFVDDLVLQRERRLLARDVTLERGEAMVRPRQDLVVEAGHQ